jgi:glutaredoxin-like protein NrdH
MLTKNGLEFSTVDITVDTDAFNMVVDMGFQSAPVVNAGDEWWSGFNPDKINGLVVN